MIKPVIAITHAAFDPARREALERLRAQLAEEWPHPYCVQSDDDRNGSLWCWQEAMLIALRRFPDATHVVWLPDDAILSKGFGVALPAAIAARPDDVFDCYLNFQVHGEAAPGSWFSTHDGYVGVGGVMPRALLEDHLRWREKNLHTTVANDLGVNMWAMATGRLTYKPCVSLVNHDASLPSLDGNDHHDARTASQFVEDASALTDWAGEVAHVGRVYKGNHWETVFRSVPASWDLEACYLAERQGEPVSEKPHVVIATPAYQPPELAYLASVARVVEDLRAHGIDATHYVTHGDSLVTRGRHKLVHDFLCSRGTHLLQWDADIECLDVTAVRKMVQTGRPIIGGAYPFRDGSGAVVANLLKEHRDSKRVDIREDDTIPVAEVGTGFLMVRRDVLVDMQKKHPELLYEADWEGYRGVPMWALFDVALEASPSGTGRMRYASEDWRFCSLARQDGYEVCIYYPPEFRHWGKQGHAGHCVRAWGMSAAQEAAQ